MRFIKGMAVLLAGFALMACGGGKDSTSSSTGASAVADVLFQLSKANIANTGSDSIIITTTALDASRNALAGATVLVTADSDAVITTASATTGADGKLQSTLTIGTNQSNRVITVSITSGTVTKTTTVQVYGAKLTGTLVPAVVAPGASGKVQYRLIDQAGNPMFDQQIQVVATGFTPAEATGKTGASGDFEFAYSAAPSASGSYDISATAGGAAAPPLTLQVQAASTIPDANMAQVTSTSVSANPSVVGTNLQGATTNRSTIRALVLGANNLPIKNVRVRFDLNGDVNTIGGVFSTGSTTLYTDVNGVVSTDYIPGTRSSPTNGVAVRACFYGTDAAAAAATPDASGKLDNCPLAQVVTLTVTAEPLGVSIGTNELIIVNELTYVKKFVVSVVDAAGVAKPDVNLVVSLDLPQYRKGFYAVVGDSWVKQPYSIDPVTGVAIGSDSAICPNEDVNRNGVLETGEDVNGSGRLDPGKSDVSVTLLQSKTRADGTAELQIQYAKSFGSWVDAKITVAASGISGTEGRASYLLAPVPVDSGSVKNKDVTPAYQKSPYGASASCTDPN